MAHDPPEIYRSDFSRSGGYYPLHFNQLLQSGFFIFQELHNRYNTTVVENATMVNIFFRQVEYLKVRVCNSTSGLCPLTAHSL